MVLSEIGKARSRMRLVVVIGVVVLAAELGAVKLWASREMSNWVLTGVLMGAVLSTVVFAWVLGTWLRNRQRRRSLDMQDSALW